VSDKFHHLEALVLVRKPSIIGISESWCNENIEDADISLQGYDLFRADRGGGVRGGGILLYIISSLGASCYDTVCSDGEWVCSRIVNEEGKELIIEEYYRSKRYQKSNVDNNQGIRDWITELHNKNIDLMGDMNYPDIDWDSRIGRSLNSQSLVDCLDYTFLTQHVQENTRGSARLDLVISKDPNYAF